MAGIYIHIPFCRQKCYYCDFYKTVNTSNKERFISALKNEIRLHKNYLDKEIINTIYFGGGTPSTLTGVELDEILTYLQTFFRINPAAEITFEANPDDLDNDYLSLLFKTGINRLSIGIQSFQDEHLKKMNRRHNANEGLKSVENAYKTGFKNISVDLIYGLPDLTARQWKESLRNISILNINHLSAYHLTYHEGTPFYTWLKKGTLKELNETESIKQFNLLLEWAEDSGYEQYEISNFARNKMYSQHNSSYWTGEKYLGLGPSAHSYNRDSRQWNISHLESYMRAIETDSVFYEKEKLSETDKFNEYILTRLRTKWGVSLQAITKYFGEEKAASFFNNIQKFIDSGKIVRDNTAFKISREGQFVSDDIMSDLIII